MRQWREALVVLVGVLALALAGAVAAGCCDCWFDNPGATGRAWPD